jgi:hypothetical protein
VFAGVVLAEASKSSNRVGKWLAARLLTRRFAKKQDETEARTQIDVIALDDGEPRLFPSAPVGHIPGQGETALARRVAGVDQDGAGCRDAGGATSVQVGDGQVRQVWESSPGKVAWE